MDYQMRHIVGFDLIGKIKINDKEKKVGKKRD